MILKKVFALLLVCIIFCSCSNKTAMPAESPSPEINADGYISAPECFILNSFEEFEQFFAFIDSDLEKVNNFSRSESGDIYREDYRIPFSVANEIKRGLEKGGYPAFNNKTPENFSAYIFIPQVIYDENKKIAGYLLNWYEFYFEIDNIAYYIRYYHKDSIMATYYKPFESNWVVDGVETQLYIYDYNGVRKIKSRITPINDEFFMEMKISSTNNTNIFLSDINFDGIHFF